MMTESYQNKYYYIIKNAYKTLINARRIIITKYILYNLLKKYTILNMNIIHQKILSLLKTLQILKEC